MKSLYMCFIGLFLLSSISYAADSFEVRADLDFGNVNQGTGKTLPLKVTNNSGAIMQVNASIGPAGVPFSINLTSMTIGDDDSAIIGVSLRNDALPGSLLATIRIASGNEIKKVQLTGNVVPLPDITFVGLTPVVQVQGTTVDVLLKIINSSTAISGATSGELLLDGTANQKFIIPQLAATFPNNQVTLNLSFPKPASGPHSIQVKLDSGNIIVEALENNNVRNQPFTIP